MVDNTLRINEERFRTEFETLSRIGGMEGGGVNRPALSPAHLEARAWLREKAREAGLEVRVDQAGNNCLKLPCPDPDKPSLILGSHLDSVPNGGRFDGALGVFSGLEVLRRIKEEGIAFPLNLEVIDFTDEEGTLVGLLGSHALTGELTQEELQNPRGGRAALLEGLERAGLKEGEILAAKRDMREVAGYLELHVEQSTRLQEAEMDAGIVSSIAGITSYKLTFLGREGHAATVPMENRQDAGIGASAFTLEARKLVLENFPTCFVNVGKMDFEPGIFNIVPGKVTLALEFRAPDLDQMRALDESLIQKANENAREFGLGLKVNFLGEHDPARMDAGMGKIIRESADRLGLRAMKLVSGPGHDAQSFADLCPTGMIFIPSRDGISHSPLEFSRMEDCINGANLLLGATYIFMQSFEMS